MMLTTAVMHSVSAWEIIFTFSMIGMLKFRSVLLSKNFSNRTTVFFFFFEYCRSTELDAVVFGHVFTLLTTPMPDNRLASIVRSYPNLVEACQFVEKIYFQAPPKVNETDDESYC